MLRSNLVYNFKLNICNDIYYTTNKHHFKARPCQDMGHNTSFDDIQNLVKESDGFRPLLRESLLVLRDDRPLNRYVK